MDVCWRGKTEIMCVTGATLTSCLVMTPNSCGALLPLVVLLRTASTFIYNRKRLHSDFSLMAVCRGRCFMIIAFG